jgi:5-formyltetrahydrofolate cyclo-ligase
MEKAPLKIGVGDGSGAIASIYPQAHDIPMDVIVTEAGRRACGG